MTLIVVELSRTSGAALFSEAAPESLRYLMGQGFYGDLEEMELWPLLAPHAGPASLVDYDPSQSAPEALAQAAGSGDLKHLHVRLAATAGDALAALDALLLVLVESLGDDDTLAILAAAPPAGAFLVVSRACPLTGPIGRATAADLALTLLALLGIPRPADLAGQALISGPVAPLDDDDEAALRERFRGLGYVA